MAVDMFLKIEPIKGESQDDTHKDEIDILAWSWGMSQSGTTHIGGGSGAGKVNVQDLSFTCYFDAATTDLMKFCTTGDHIEEATLVVRKAGGKALEYVVLTMKDLIVSSVSTGAGGGEDRLTINVSLNFGAYEMKYTPQTAQGEAGTETEWKYDIAANKEI